MSLLPPHSFVSYKIWSEQYDKTIKVSSLNTHKKVKYRRRNKMSKRNECNKFGDVIINMSRYGHTLWFIGINKDMFT